MLIWNIQGLMVHRILIFRTLRKLFKVDPADYMISLCGNDALRELSSPGKSGSFFYLTNDDRYMIKTVKKAEVKVSSFFCFPRLIWDKHWTSQSASILVSLQQLLTLKTFQTMSELLFKYLEFGPSGWIILKLSCFAIYWKIIYSFWLITQRSHKLLVLLTRHYLISLIFETSTNYC